jgi:hypothetical protein
MKKPPLLLSLAVAFGASAATPAFAQLNPTSGTAGADYARPPSCYYGPPWLPPPPYFKCETKPQPQARSGPARRRN